MITGTQYRYVDPEYVNEMADGEDDFIIQIVSIYLDTIPENINKLIHAAEGTDYAEIIFYTHKLRGSLNFIGGKQLIGTLDQIDALCVAQTDLPSIRQLVTEIIPISNNIKHELASILKQVKETQADNA